MATGRHNRFMTDDSVRAIASVVHQLARLRARHGGHLTLSQIDYIQTGTNGPLECNRSVTVNVSASSNHDMRGSVFRNPDGSLVLANTEKGLGQIE